MEGQDACSLVGPRLNNINESFDVTLAFDKDQVDEARHNGINRHRKEKETNMDLSELVSTVVGDLVCETPLRS